MESNGKHSKFESDYCHYNGAQCWRSLLWYTSYGYVFWCLFLALAPMIWFYPLNELGITGYEMLSLVSLAPIITESIFILKLLQKPFSLSLLHLLSIASLLSFQAPDTLTRLCILSFGVMCTLLAFTVSLWNPDTKIRYLTLWGLLLGFLLFLVSRIWYLSFVPAWWDPNSNTVVFSVVLVVSLDHIISSSRNSVAETCFSRSSSTDLRPEEEKKNNDTKEDLSNKNLKLPDVPYKRTDIFYDKKRATETSQTPKLVTNGTTSSNSNNVSVNLAHSSSLSFLIVGAGFGSLIFLTGWIFGEVSLMCRWVVEGYPNHGPLPLFWGCPVLLALGIGVYLTTQSFTNQFDWWLVGVLNLVLLYYLRTWLAYTSGLFLAVFTVSVWPNMVCRASHCSAGRTVFVAMLTWLAESFFFVWTVAYNFVPGGIYTREHTDYLILFISITLLSTHFTGAAIKSSTDVFQHYHSIMWSNIKKAILVIVCIGLLGFSSRSYSLEQPKRSKVFSAAIWTFHFGYDNYGWPNLERAAQLLRDTDADLIALLESDASKPFLGNNDLGMWLGQKLGMYVDFGPSTSKHTWGNLILSKYPIMKSMHHLLPSPRGELAPALNATVNISGSLVDFVVTHMGNDRDNEDRKLQAIYLSNVLKSSPHPAVFLGYVTSEPYSRDYRRLTEGSSMKDIDPTDVDRWCQYIMYKNLTRLGYARISRGDLSDTEIQMAKFRIPQKPSSYKDRHRVTYYPEDVPAYQRFSSKFVQSFEPTAPSTKQKHVFHMSTPKYFI
ncbi:PGAP2-interacting protein-like [Argonauta hians]